MTADQYFDGSFVATGDEYASIRRFVEVNPSISYARMDAHLLQHLSLFAIRENFDFEGLESALDQILQALPAIKRIFAKPITRLKDTSDILPVEVVRVVNNRTITHASLHSELWDDITAHGLKPRKLLTLNYEDNYSIYENIVFARVIDLIRHLVGQNIRMLRDMLYTGQDLRFNLLDRDNHLSYYLALGKLHIGYVKEFDQYRVEAERCLNKLLFIDEVIRTRLNSPVYKQCKGKTGKIALKKTNVFRNHKDYHRIYLLSKWFSEAKIGDHTEEDANLRDSGEGYGLFCTLLTIFAAGHFGFTFPEAQPIDFYRVHIECENLDWRLKLDTVFCDSVAAIRLQMCKDVPYSVILLPATDSARGLAMLSRFRLQYDADEYLLATPIEGAQDSVYLSLYDIESFRRVQQILLRAMIYADERRSICPFCGRPLALSEDQRYECAACRTVIAKQTCSATGRRYFTTEIKNHRLSNERDDAIIRDRLLYMRRLEGQLHYRNITPIGEGAELICPHCKQVHSE